MKKTNNERNAGRPSKFSKGGEMKKHTFSRYVPVKAIPILKEKFDEVINQFKDYDFT